MLLMKAHQELSLQLSGAAQREELNEIINIARSYDFWEHLPSGESSRECK
jgi:hypothetical protein